MATFELLAWTLGALVLTVLAAWWVGRPHDYKPRHCGGPHDTESMHFEHRMTDDEWRVWMGYRGRHVRSAP